MKRIRFTSLACLAAFALVGVLGIASAIASPPTPTSAVIVQRIFNNCASSTLTTGNSYPASLFVNDAFPSSCNGGANLHTWLFSTNGTTAALFNNSDAFEYAADFVLSGTGDGEAGLLVRPWWSQSDGRFNCRTPDGEIACFGGVLPFYSFTGTNGIHYVKGTSIHLGIKYIPNLNRANSPATIEYKVTYNAVNYTSGPVAFTNVSPPSEDGTYGSYGILNQARVGGHFQQPCVGTTTNLRATWTNITYSSTPNQKQVPGMSPVNQAAMGLGLLMLGGLVIAFRRKLMPQAGSAPLA